MVKLANALVEAGKGSPKVLELLAAAAGWKEFAEKELAEETKRQKVDKVPRKASCPNSTKAEKDEAKSCYDVLYQLLTTYDYSQIQDQPAVDMMKEENPEEKAKQEEAVGGEMAFLNDYATNNFWRAVPQLQIDTLMDDYS